MRALFFACVALAACQPANRTDPVTGKSYYSPLGGDYASQDEYVRRSYLTEIAVANDGGLLPEPAIAEACRTIFLDVVRALPADHRRGFEYHFFVTASPLVNAYTYGGGRVHCLLGLVADCEDASEFAGVLAHEVGHISHDHIGQQLGRAQRFRDVTSLGGILRGPGRTLTESIGGLIGAPVLLSHSRGQEREADDRAVEYLFAAGYDPDGLARWFSRLARNERHGLAFLRSHPHSSDRVERIRKRIAARGGTPANAVRTTPAYARAHARAVEILPSYLALVAALEKDDPTAILKAASAGVAALPRHGQFHFWRGAALEIGNDRTKALAALAEAARLDRANVLYAYVLAILALDAKEYATAEEGATGTLALIPAIPAAWLIRGLARYHLGRKDEAYKDFDILVSFVETDRDRAKLIADIRKQAPDYPGGA